METSQGAAALKALGGGTCSRRWMGKPRGLGQPVQGGVGGPGGTRKNAGLLSWATGGWTHLMGFGARIAEPLARFLRAGPQLTLGSEVSSLMKRVEISKMRKEEKSPLVLPSRRLSTHRMLWQEEGVADQSSLPLQQLSQEPVSGL